MPRAIELQPVSIAGSAMSVIDQIREPDRRSAFLATTYPLLESIQTIHTGMLDILDKNGVTERQILTYLDKPMTPRDLLSVSGKKEFKLATQYEHVKKVLRTTLALKKNFIENKLPERIVGYQTGTGWPLPEENENCKQVGFIRYGTEDLSDFSPAGSDTDKKAGMYIYRVKGKDGNEITLLALKGRYHAYTETDTPLVPHHDLAFMPRVLKGLGTEFILSSFASGVDKVKLDVPFKKTDCAVVVGSTDLSTLSTHMGPGTGDQRIIGSVFGGSFLGIANELPPSKHTQLLIDTFKTAREEDGRNIDELPDLFPAFEVDTLRTPNFQAPYEHAAPRPVVAEMKVADTLPNSRINMFGRKPMAVVEGMVQIIERDTNYQSQPDPSLAFQSPWNRTLPDLGVVSFTDYVDPREEGESKETTDAGVKEVGGQSKEFMSRLITRFFHEYASQPA